MNDRNANQAGTPNTDLLSIESATYLEGLYQSFLQNPSRVDTRWRKAFNQLSATPVQPLPSQAVATGQSKWDPEIADKQAGVIRLINHYRSNGHLAAQTNPLEGNPVPLDELAITSHGLSESDLDQAFFTGFLSAEPRMPLRDIEQLLQAVYCRSLGFEYMYITDPAQRRWIQSRIEKLPALTPFSTEERRYFLDRLTAAEGLEKYLHTKYVGQKRFSLEGGDCLIPMVHDQIQQCGQYGAKEIIIGMAHRGRLNILVNVLGKNPSDLFSEFEGNQEIIEDDANTGDVKYHMGFSSDILTPGGPVHLALSFNPSHLEIISPVVEGSVRARQHRRMDRDYHQIIPILVHGDAALAGQGVVMETLNMSELRGYKTGGTIHIVINNQIGFTTSNPEDARSTTYCTDIAKMLQVPVLHVNGDDLDAVMFASRLALEYRMEFHRDVFIDLVCYRRLGHNEADEPSITQPLMYRKIKTHSTTRTIYAEQLVREGVITVEQAQTMERGYRDNLSKGKIVAGQIAIPEKHKNMVDWRPYIGVDWTTAVDTCVGVERIQRLMNKVLTLPANFTPHPRISKLMEDRRRMNAGDLAMDWGFAELAAYATLLEEGFEIRLTGEDTGRGTFSHRQAILHDYNTGKELIPLTTAAQNPEQLSIINSLLSEEATLGFEYGYATTNPQALVIWEGQFGDFVNGAQVLIDQFICSGEAKWERLCGLTLFLPHGYDGQGPEHSSARIERFLQLCAAQNIQVCVPSSPAQMFHMLRRQMIRPMRRPLIVMTPKSLLRRKLSASRLDELSDQNFQNLIPETSDLDDTLIERVVLCSGKVYYDLYEQRLSLKQHCVALLRIEQLYPFPRDELREQLGRYPQVKDIVWCQEEPQNQGAWYQIQHHISSCLLADQTLGYTGRTATAAPAVGNHKLHIKQQKSLVNKALDLEAA
ncbi:MAG TPA: 2-oxoglutarate dehydrogenase E1 component [Gammaproteobacteria bacterium]|nr:2-oxoglutarate dehydrogenase E1 component [Gammaproteobacteria bacterium]